MLLQAHQRAARQFCKTTCPFFNPHTKIKDAARGTTGKNMRPHRIFEGCAPALWKPPASAFHRSYQTILKNKNFQQSANF